MRRGPRIVLFERLGANGGLWCAPLELFTAQANARREADLDTRAATKSIQKEVRKKMRENVLNSITNGIIGR